MFIDDYEDDENFVPKTEKEIVIPEFLKKKNDVELPTEEQIVAQAMLNNVPNNTDIEKQNHLAELERACQNWDEEEWIRVLYHAPSGKMADEFKRRMKTYEVFMSATRGALETLTEQKL